MSLVETTTVTCIVEGDGEVSALPVQLRRICAWQTPDLHIEINFPIRVRRDKFLNKDDEFRRHILLARHKSGPNGWILILLDADDDCPAELAVDITDRAKKIDPLLQVAVVLANREYEAWFIAAATSLNGHRGFTLAAGDQVPDAELRRDAKGWVRERMPRGAYRETSDQAAFSAVLSLGQTHENSRSFRKLCAEWTKHCNRN